MEKEEGGHLPFLDIEIHRKTDSTRTYPPMKMEQTQCSETSGITQKKAYDIQNTVKVRIQEDLQYVLRL